LSPLEAVEKRVEQASGMRIKEGLEERKPWVVEPWWEPPSVTIAESRDEAKKNHERITAATGQRITIYTDGSGINGKVGAAAVSSDGATARSAYLGRGTEYTVYAAELLGILMALSMVEGQGAARAVIFTDNQASLQAIRDPRGQSGQYIIERITQALVRTRQRGQDIEFHWIPAHQGIEGNETADRMAKEATGWRRQRGRRGRWIEQDTDSTAPTPHFMRSLKAATKCALTKQIQQRWRNEWHHESRGRAVYKLTPQPTPKTLALHQARHRALSSVITQMRTEKIGLRQFLYQRHVPGVEDGQCECGRGSQTVRHVLLACPRHTVLRRRIWGEVPGRRIEGKDLKEILNTPAQATKAAKFMILTRLLGQFGAVSKDEIMQDEH